MSLIPIKIGPFSSIFIGNAGGVVPLVEITGLYTRATPLRDATGSTYFHGVNLQLQSGVHSVSTTINFLGEGVLLYNICKGLSVSNTDKNTTPGQQEYTLLLVHEDAEDESSVLMTPCHSSRDLTTNYEKLAAQEITLNFTAEHRDVNEQIVWYGTVDDLDAVLGAQSPF